MSKYICKQCSKTFEYCRGCLLVGDPYKDAGYCSKACYEESKIPKIEEVIHKDVEAVVIEEDTPTSIEEVVEYPIFFAETSEDIVVEEVKATPKKKKNKNTKKENIIDDNEQSNP